MKILLTNDDGIHSEGLRVLARELTMDHEVWILAPDGERSGTSHAMTLKRPALVRQLGEREFSCSGMPVDCILLSGYGVLPVCPDIVIAGINHGPNLGTDLIYSGTAGAARQASLQGKPAIAVSLATYTPPFDFLPGARFIRRNLDFLISLWKPGIFINVNVPASRNDEIPEAVFANPGRRTYRDKLTSFEAPDGSRYCFLNYDTIEDENASGSDTAAIKSGKTAISAILLAPQTPAEFLAGPCATGSLS
jgi:5'-nucleotidase